MATKLKNLRISKVDFVDQGANPDADIKLYKRREESTQGDSRKKNGGVLKKLFNLICKAAGIDPDELDSEMDEITKGDSESFNDKINEVKNMKIADEMWDVCYALQSSLLSILNDDELDSDEVEKAMQESLDEFYDAVKESIKKWSSGKAAGIEKKDEGLTDDDVRMMKSAVARLNESIEKAAAPASENQQTIEIEQQRGEETEMKIDKSKLTEAEKAFLESIEKRYGTGEEGDPGTAALNAAVQQPVPALNPTVAKSGAQPAAVPPADDTDIYKGMNPVVAAELEELKKFREATEEKELTEIAKRYELIGKKPEELVPVLKSLKAAGGTAYNDMIAVLDQTLEMVEKSGAFSEIGKSGQAGNVNSAEAKIDDIAKKMVSEDPTISYESAVAKAWEEHPELLDEYDEQEGF